MRADPSVSLIIPLWRDTVVLQRLLANLAALALELAEIIVVDAEHDSEHAQLCRQAGACYITVGSGLAGRCRGRQLNTGAAAAQSDVLWFVHADAQLLPAALDNLLSTIQAGAVGGYFSFRFQGRGNCWRRWLAAAINLRCRIGVPYGDQGLFVTRAAYTAAGGFSDQPLFEEVALIRSLRKQGVFKCAGNGMLVSPRRWQRDGWIRRTLHNRLLACGYLLGVPATRLARCYRSGHPG